MPYPRTDKVQIVAAPVSMRTLALIGVVVFAVGFWHGRQLRDLETGGGDFRTAAVGPQPSTLRATAADDAKPPSQPEQSTVKHVTIQMMKFPAVTLEVRVGDEVEWSNDDLTQHTVTSDPKGSPNLNSGPIDASTSWRHRFTTPGTFPYHCTFHPEMKGSVRVR